MKKAGILLGLFAVLLAGCNPPNVTNSSPKEALPSLITLTCNPDFRFEPCQNMQFNKPDEIRMFVEAIEEAEIIPGNMNYVAQYKMNIMNKDDSLMKYDFSIGSDPEMKALLVNHEDTTTGYSISIQDANRIRKLIQSHTD
ncbi:hypothetical protein [Paenibacillus sp. FSL K6-0108]|uniref:hypothetical protein n=1 Tax=Paenibacillus sp. FSL K6-0108 TaxID=2921417 RepID=UPI00324C5549